MDKASRKRAEEWLDEKEKDRPIVPPYVRHVILDLLAEYSSYERRKELE